MVDDCNGMPGTSTGAAVPGNGQTGRQDVPLHPLSTHLDRGVDKGAVLARRKRHREDALATARIVGEASKSFHDLSRSVVLNAVVSVGAWISDHGLWESGWYGPKGVLAEEDVLPEIALTLDASRKRPRADQVIDGA